MSPFFITCAIDYANGDPHLGHALEKIGADAIARAHRQLGDDVWFLIGMDEHGQKVAQTAEAAGVAPQQFVDGVAERFVRTWQTLAISHDQFMRTSHAAHHAAVTDLLERIFTHTPDAFYERSYTGQYCVGCESFKQAADLHEGRCALHPTRTLEDVTERNWFFRLSAYTKPLTAHFAAHPEFLQPAHRRNEILALLDQGLEDISASRARIAWGVPFPRPIATGETQTTYVWFDALPNYWTAQFFPGSRAPWPATVHVVGKDITRFHTVIWPAMLMAAGLPLPAQVWAHGFITLGGERFSKSAGVKLELSEAITRFGPDAFRYYLLRDIPFDGDGAFSWERFEAVYTAELANGLGNLASRTTAMVEKYCEGIVPAGARTADDAADLADYAEARTALDRRFGGWRATGEERRPAPVLVTARRASGVQLILVDKPGAAQSVINVVAPGVERTTGDFAAIEVMNTILGGSFSSRLNTLLRETKGYTYGISSGFSYRPLPGPFTVSTAVRTDVTESALVDIFRELRTIRETPVTNAELERAKAYLGLAVPGDLETIGQVASEVATLALWNLPIDYLTEYVQRVGQVTAADVQRVARAFVPTENAWVIVVGDLAKVRAPIERLGLGTITVREVGSLTR